MKKPNHKNTLYAVMRKDIPLQHDIVCCFARTVDGAERLCNEYQQSFHDSGGDSEESYFYVVANIYYDE